MGEPQVPIMSEQSGKTPKGTGFARVAKSRVPERKGFQTSELFLSGVSDVARNTQPADYEGYQSPSNGDG